MSALRRFSELDWYGFAGCQRFKDGSEPLIAYYPPGDVPEGFAVVADVDSVGVYFWSEHPDKNDSWILPVSGITPALAAVIASHILDNGDEVNDPARGVIFLKCLGFVEC